MSTELASIVAGVAGVAFILANLVAAGCAERIGPPPNDNPDAQSMLDDAMVQTGPVRTTPNPDGSSTSIIDSSAAELWTHLDIDTFSATDEAGPWALRFQRFHISTAVGTEVAPLSAAFDAVTTAPSSGWQHDQDTDGDGEVDYAFEQGDGWYDYNADTHVLTPKPLVWVVRSATSTLKMKLEKYYDTAGTAGWFTLTWRRL
jgi:hypothetical protein